MLFRSTMLNRAAPKAASPRRGRPGGRPELNSPVRKAIAYLLHRPDLAGLAAVPKGLGDADMRGMEVLKAVLEFARTHPHINGAALLEHWRDSETGTYLEKLAQAELVTPPEAMASEFQAVMADLGSRRPAERRFQELASRDFSTLTNEEKAEFRRMQQAARPQNTGLKG